MFLQEAERLFFLQRAKCDYLKLSDRYTKFFHGMVKHNAKCNFIAVVVKENGELSTFSSQVVEKFIRFYENLLGTTAPNDPINAAILSFGAKLSNEQARSLVTPIDDQEIKNVLFDIGDDKALGPDGYSACLFKKA